MPKEVWYLGSEEVQAVRGRTSIFCYRLVHIINATQFDNVFFSKIILLWSLAVLMSQGGVPNAAGDLPIGQSALAPTRLSWRVSCLMLRRS